MMRLIVMVVIAFVVWQGYAKYQRSAMEREYAMPEASSAAQFKCDGRIYCSQMTSCEEATFFLRNCPGAKMDGNHDGVPCERQWCR